MVVIVSKVRAAAVFALGRFTANTGERSDQANQIDFGVAMKLTHLSQDGSPLVRKVSKKEIVKKNKNKSYLCCYKEQFISLLCLIYFMHTLVVVM